MERMSSRGPSTGPWGTRVEGGAWEEGQLLTLMNCWRLLVRYDCSQERATPVMFRVGSS